MTTEERLAALSMLDWYAKMGATELVAENSINWFERSQQAEALKVKSKSGPIPPRQGAASPGPAPRKAPQAPNIALQNARQSAQSAENLQALEEAVLSFDGCNLKATAKKTCFARGAQNADLMCIGEAPGRDEDLQGQPFVGRAGQLLDKMLNAINRDEANTYITNIVYWRPPGNRTPTPQETEICQPFLNRQITLLKPKVIIFLGGAAAKTLLNTTDGIMRLRGKWKTIDIDGATYPAMATLHPAYLLRNPIAKRLAWRDLIAIREKLEEDTDGRPN